MYLLGCNSIQKSLKCFWERLFSFNLTKTKTKHNQVYDAKPGESASTLEDKIRIWSYISQLEKPAQEKFRDLLGTFGKQ